MTFMLPRPTRSTLLRAATVLSAALVFPSLTTAAPTAWADSATCGARTADIAGTYKGIGHGQSTAPKGATLTLNADGNGTFEAEYTSSSTVKWDVRDGATEVVISVAGWRGIYVLIPGCAGAKTQAETLNGGVSNSYESLDLHRNV